MLRRALLATGGSRFCRVAATQTRQKITVPNAGGERRRRLKPKMPKNKFTALSTEFLDRVQTAVEPLHPPVNEEFHLQRDGNSELAIRTNAKEFVIKVLPSKQQIEFSSPVSGLRTYQWNAMTKRWEDEADSHDIEGLLTRDLMRFCAGIPLFLESARVKTTMPHRILRPIADKASSSEVGE